MSKIKWDDELDEEQYEPEIEDEKEEHRGDKRNKPRRVKADHKKWNEVFEKGKVNERSR